MPQGQEPEAKRLKPQESAIAPTSGSSSAGSSPGLATVASAATAPVQPLSDAMIRVGMLFSHKSPNGTAHVEAAEKKRGFEQVSNVGSSSSSSAIKPQDLDTEIDEAEKVAAAAEQAAQQARKKAADLREAKRQKEHTAQVRAAADERVALLHSRCSELDVVRDGLVKAREIFSLWDQSTTKLENITGSRLTREYRDAHPELFPTTYQGAVDEANLHIKNFTHEVLELNKALNIKFAVSPAAVATAAVTGIIAGAPMIASAAASAPAGSASQPATQPLQGEQVQTCHFLQRKLTVAQLKSVQEARLAFKTWVLSCSPIYYIFGKAYCDLLITAPEGDRARLEKYVAERIRSGSLDGESVAFLTDPKKVYDQFAVLNSASAAGSAAAAPATSSSSAASSNAAGAPGSSSSPRFSP
ncbi:MAG TPA: hypothetical protein VLG38_07560 [Gammaproteobacteria bacterium]|nr:hypothetical protein [Gammaproteobacteria bacterium]